MTQVRIYEYGANDSTFNIFNRALNGILPAGLYCGFDFSPTANMTLTMIQGSTGLQFSDINLAQDRWSCIRSQQGVIVMENGNITVTMSANASTDPRIDVVYMEHVWQQILGGSNATYGVVQGTPATNPSAPALPNPEKQVKIAEIYIPGSTSALNATGVIYTKARTPTLGGVDFFARTNDTNVFTMLNKFISFAYNGGFTSSAVSASKITLPSDPNNLYSIDTGGNFDEIDEDTPVDGKPLFFYCNDSGVIQSGGNLRLPRAANHSYNVGDAFIFMYNSTISKYICLSMQTQQVALLEHANKFTSQLSLADSTAATIDTDGTALVDLDHNTFTITAAADTEIKSLATTEKGTRISLLFSGAYQILLRHNVAVSGYALILPAGKDMIVRSGDAVLFEQINDKYILIGTSLSINKVFDKTEIDLV